MEKFRISAYLLVALLPLLAACGASPMAKDTMSTDPWTAIAGSNPRSGHLELMDGEEVVVLELADHTQILMSLPPRPIYLSCADPMVLYTEWWILRGPPTLAMQFTEQIARMWQADEAQSCLVTWPIWRQRSFKGALVAGVELSSDFSEWKTAEDESRALSRVVSKEADVLPTEGPEKLVLSMSDFELQNANGEVLLSHPFDYASNHCVELKVSILADKQMVRVQTQQIEPDCAGGDSGSTKRLETNYARDVAGLFAPVFARSEWSAWSKSEGRSDGSKGWATAHYYSTRFGVVAHIVAESTFEEQVSVESQNTDDESRACSDVTTGEHKATRWVFAPSEGGEIELFNIEDGTESVDTICD